MIQITNDFLPQEAFLDLQDYCYSNIFKNADFSDGKQISYLETPMELLEFLQKPNHELVLTFIRNANSETDTLPNIHADNILNGRKIDLASVLYINQFNDCELNGTGFWSHNNHGTELQKNVSEEEFNRLLIEDSNDVSKWNQTDKIQNFPNRQLLYKANMFHSKYPSKIIKGNRMVLCCFYCRKPMLSNVTKKVFGNRHD